MKIGEIRRDFQFQVLACQILSISIAPTSTVCQGQVATLTGSGALAGWTYSWNAGAQIGPIATGMSGVNGTTTFTATATNGVTCLMNTGAFITNSPTASIATTGNVCLGQNTTLTASGAGTGGTYNWMPGSVAGSVLTGVANGQYTVTSTNTNACTASAVGNIYQAPVITSTVSVNNVNCPGTTASATITASPGSPPYTYTWTGTGQTTSAVTGLANGNYSVTVADSRGCTVVKAFTVAVTSSPTTPITPTSAGCTVSNGTAVVNPTGGGGSYTYLWGNGQTTQTATGLTAGSTYSVVVTSANGCTGTNLVTISVTANPTIASSSSSPTACSVSNGTATASGSGGTGTYTYIWSAGQTAQTATGLAQGNYSVTVKDANGCTVAGTVSVSITANPTISSSSSTPAGCAVANGTATATGLGGTGAFTYIWSSGQTAQTATGLAQGNYTVTVKDANGCTVAGTVSVSITANPTISSSSSTPSGCTVASGTASANGAGGTGTYTYIWSSGQTAQTATGLASGNYTVTIKDSNGCSNTGTVSVAPTNPPTIATTSSTIAGCSVSNGTATANPSGGTGGYTYTWSPGGQNTQTATGLAGGDYTVTVADANNCTAVTTVSVGITMTPSVTATSSQATCGNSNGSATANASGGTPGYTYFWNIGQTSQTATGLASGLYTVTITDLSGCTTSGIANVSNANGPTSTTTVNANVLCFGGNNGSATTNPSVGTPGYTYTWSNGQTNQTATGLSAGNYNVIVADANGCTNTNTLSISQPTLLTSSTTQAAVLCNGGSTGSASITSAGGTPGYTYSWSSGQSTSAITGIAAGNYSVTITDANGCTTSQTLTISQPTLLTSVASQTNVSCNGGSNATATVNASAGTPGYSYSWSGGQTTSAISGIPAGNYSVTVTDANGCTRTSTLSVTQPSAITSSTAQTAVLCNGGSTGSASVTAGGGTPGYTYSWSNGQSASAISAVAAGNYSVTITDANGCSGTNTIAITQPAALISSTSQAAILCNGGTANASVNAAGGTLGYSYNWSSGQTTSAATLGNGSYTVTITDANGCTTTNTITLTQPAVLGLQVSGNDSLCAGDTVSLTATPVGGTPAYTYIWTPGPLNGQTISVNPTSSTTYSVITTDANGCTSITQVFSLSILPNPTALFDTVSNGQFGSIFQFNDLSTGGSSWYWDFGDGSTSTLQNPVNTFPGAGTYTVTQIVYNQFGCPDTFRIVLDFEDGIIIPNVFTPDGDGTNDVWYIPSSGLRTYHVDIFDRWGLKVFESTADQIRWDGRSAAGQLLSDGTYFYTLTAVLSSFQGDKDYSTKGHITLLTAKRKSN